MNESNHLARQGTRVPVLTSLFADLPISPGGLPLNDLHKLDTS